MKAAAAFCLSVLTLAVSAPSLLASPLRGTEVTGVLHVDGDTGNDFAPTRARVGPGIEFNAAVETGDDLCEYVANLSNAKIGIRDVCTPLTAAIAADLATAVRQPKPTFTMTFTDAALAGDLITPLKNGLDLTYSLSGDQLTLTFDDTDPSSNRSTFAVTSAVTPEPASWQLLMLGVVCAGAMAYSSRSRTVLG